MKKELPIALSNRHCHLSQEDLEILFGKGHELTPIKNLSQPGQFACEESIEVSGPKGSLKMRVLGPVRSKSQIEVLTADTFKLGVPAMIRESGKLDGTPGVKLVGPQGEVELSQGVIVAGRHIHMSLDDGKDFGVKDGDIVNVRVGGERALVFENVLARVSDQYALEMHVDTEEGNAAGCKNGMIVELV